MLLPIIFALLLLVIRSRIPKTDVAQTSYLEETQLIAMPVFPIEFNSVFAITPNCSLTNSIEKSLESKYSS